MHLTASTDAEPAGTSAAARPPTQGAHARHDPTPPEPASPPRRGEAAPASTPPARMPPIRPSLRAAQLAAVPDGQPVQVTLAAITADQRLISGTLVEPDPAKPLRRYHPTTVGVLVRWSADTPVVMGTAADVQPGALLRVHGRLRRPAPSGAAELQPAGRVEVEAARLAILTGTATVTDPDRAGTDPAEPT